MDEPIRVCPECGLDKPLSQFKGLPGQRIVNCKSCRAHARIIKSKYGAVTRANIQLLRAHYDETIGIMRPREGNLRMVDQRFAGAILSVINQL